MKVVFVEPESSGNIGFLARTMANFGLEELVLVNPKCELNEETKSRACNAFSIIENTKILSSFEEAIKGDFVVGTTAIKAGNITRSAITPRELSAKIPSGNQVIVFGRESHGLNNEELEKCDVVVRIPCHESYETLNITHAAAIIFYELFHSEPFHKESSKEERDFLIKVFSVLAREKTRYDDPDTAVKMFRNVISRAFILKPEARAISGVLNAAKK